MRDTHIDLRETHCIGAGTKERLLSPHQYSVMRNHGMTLCGLSDTDDQFLFIRKRPRHAQILLALDGSGEVLVDGQWQALHPGEAYVTPIGINHAYRARGQWRVAWVAYAASACIPQTYPQIIKCPDNELAHLMESVLREALGPADRLALAAWFQLIHTNVRRIIGADRSVDRLDRMWETVHQDLAAEWTAGDLARLLSVSEEHLRRLCQKRFQVSPLRHLCDLRMQHAASLLHSSDLQIATIASQVGYHNAFAFATAFKRWSALTPSAYRQGK